MTTREENEMMTRTGPGTPAGEWMRRFWQPVALSEEMPEGGRPMPVRILSEDLVLFRDEFGKLGLLQRQCPHRCTDLSFGRIEDGGLRCLYHGWLFDREGNCKEQPGEPPESTFKDEIRARAYPVREAGGLVFTYMGRDEPPELPDYEPFHVPEEHRLVKRSVIYCNYLQALEGGYDPVHLSFLHRPIKRKDTRPIPGSDKSADNYYAGDLRPHLEFEKTEYGLRIYSIRKSGEDKKYVRTTNFILPDIVAIVGQEGRIGEGFNMHWHVPIDDHHNMRYDLVFNRVKPVEKERHRKRWKDDFGPDGMRRALGNRYFQSPDLMENSNFTGMGDSFQVHDAFATESMGPIQDRTQENLATSDRIIVQARRIISDSIKKVRDGGEPQHRIPKGEKWDASQVVVVSEVIPADDDHTQLWKKKARQYQAAE